MNDSIKFFVNMKICYHSKQMDPVSIYLFKVNNRNTTTRREICSKLTIKTPERHQWRRSGVLIVYFEQVNANWGECRRLFRTQSNIYDGAFMRTAGTLIVSGFYRLGSRLDSRF